MKILTKIEGYILAEAQIFNQQFIDYTYRINLEILKLILSEPKVKIIHTAARYSTSEDLWHVFREISFLDWPIFKEVESEPLVFPKYRPQVIVMSDGTYDNVTVYFMNAETRQYMCGQVTTEGIAGEFLLHNEFKTYTKNKYTLTGEYVLTNQKNPKSSLVFLLLAMVAGKCDVIRHCKLNELSFVAMAFLFRRKHDNDLIFKWYNDIYLAKTSEFVGILADLKVSLDAHKADLGKHEEKIMGFIDAMSRFATNISKKDYGNRPFLKYRDIEFCILMTRHIRAWLESGGRPEDATLSTSYQFASSLWNTFGRLRAHHILGPCYIDMH